MPKLTTNGPGESFVEIVHKIDKATEGKTVDFLPKIVNSCIKPSLEPHVAHHAEKTDRTSIQEVLSKPVINVDNALVEVTFSGDIEISLVLRTIASFNRRREDVIQVFYEPFLRRFEATMILQRWFKGILFRRRTKPIFKERGKYFVLGPSMVGRLITLENTLYSHYVIIQRVARRIQRSFRRWRLRIRLSCLINIAEYASQIDSNELYLEQTTYRYLESIFKRATGAPWHKPKEE